MSGMSTQEYIESLQTRTGELERELLAKTKVLTPGKPFDIPNAVLLRPDDGSLPVVGVAKDYTDCFEQLGVKSLADLVEKYDRQIEALKTSNDELAEAFTMACNDGWADGPSAATSYLAKARIVLADSERQQEPDMIGVDASDGELDDTV
jgi:hypothetical protein